MAVQINVAANQAALVQSIQAGVQAYNQRFANQNQVNLQVNARAFSQPLGRITGDVKDFEAALAASNARVIAFGASTAVLGGVLRSFRSIAEVTIEVEKNLADINRVFGLTTKELQKFSTDLFNVSKQTASSFGDAAKAALEFSRQGVKAEEVLQRTTDAMTLARLAGMNVNNAIEALTATVNGFQATGITTTQVLNKLVAVEQSYAVSAGDLAEALSRTGLAAQEAGVNIDQLNALVTAAQEKTARGGAVIGNALKTIFTRLQRTETLDQLEAFNIGVRDIQGNILPAVQILQNFAGAYNNLADSQRAQLSEQVAGVYQVNILKAIIGDLNNKQGAYAGALQKGTTATNEAQIAAAQLNQTLDALLSQTSTVAQQFANNVGKVTFEPLAKYTAESFKSLFENLNEILEGEGVGSTFANGLLKGIRNVLAGPGAIGAFFVLFKLIQNSFTYLSQALPQIVGITTETQNRKNIEQAILQIMQQQGPISQALAGQMGNQAAQAQLLLQLARQQTAEYQRQQALVAALAPALSAQGVTVKGSGGLRVTRSGGYIPKEAKLQETIGAIAGGYVPGRVVESPVGGVMNTAEQVKYMPGFAQPFINPPANSQAGRTHRRNSINRTGVDPYMNNGFIPNFAEKILSSIKEVKDGDTIEALPINPNSIDYRLASVDAPENNQKFYNEAKNLLANKYLNPAGVNILNNNIVKGKSAYFRSIFNDPDISRTLVQQGLAVPDFRYTRDTSLLTLTEKAKKSREGIWGDYTVFRDGSEFPFHPKARQYEYQKEVFFRSFKKAQDKKSIYKSKQEPGKTVLKNKDLFDSLTYFGSREAYSSGYIPNFAAAELPTDYYIGFGQYKKLNNRKIRSVVDRITAGQLKEQDAPFTEAQARAAGWRPSSEAIQERKQGVLQRVLSSGFKRIGIAGIGTLPSNTTTSQSNPFAKNFERLALEKAKQMFATNNIVFASNYEKGGKRFHGAPGNTRIDALEDNLTGPVIEMKSGDTTPDATLRTKFTQAKNELIEMWHSEKPLENIDNIVRSIGGRPEYLFYNADKEVKRGIEQIIQASRGFIPNFYDDEESELGDAIARKTGSQLGIDSSGVLNVGFMSSEFGNPLYELKSLFESGQVKKINAGEVVGPRIPNLIVNLKTLLPFIRKKQAASLSKNNIDPLKKTEFINSIFKLNELYVKYNELVNASLRYNGKPLDENVKKEILAAKNESYNAFKNLGSKKISYDLEKDALAPKFYSDLNSPKLSFTHKGLLLPILDKLDKGGEKIADRIPIFGSFVPQELIKTLIKERGKMVGGKRLGGYQSYTSNDLNKLRFAFQTMGVNEKQTSSVHLEDIYPNGLSKGFIPNFADLKINTIAGKNSISSFYNRDAKVGDKKLFGTVSAYPVDGAGDLYSVGTSQVSITGAGFGVPLYDSVLAEVSKKGAWLTSDRLTVTDKAIRIWDGYRKLRTADVINKKLPMKYWNLNPAFNGGSNEFSMNPEKDFLKNKSTWPSINDPIWSLQHAYQFKKSNLDNIAKSKGFIPNFAADYINQVMNLESNMSGNKAVLDTKSGPFPFIRNSSQPNFAAAISDHGGLNNALSDSIKNQKDAGLMNKGFVPNFAGMRRQQRQRARNQPQPSATQSGFDPARLEAEINALAAKTLNDIRNTFLSIQAYPAYYLLDPIENGYKALKNNIQSTFAKTNSMVAASSGGLSNSVKSFYQKMMKSLPSQERLDKFTNTAMFAVPMIAAQFESAYFGNKERTDLSATERMGKSFLSTGLTSISTGASIGNMIFPGLGGAVGAAVGGLVAFTSSLSAATLSADELMQLNEKQTQKAQESIQSASSYIDAQKNLTDMIAKGASSTEIENATKKLSDNFSQIKDVKLQDAFIAAGGDVTEMIKKLQQYTTEVAKQSAKRTGMYGPKTLTSKERAGALAMGFGADAKTYSKQVRDAIKEAQKAGSVARENARTAGLGYERGMRPTSASGEYEKAYNKSLMAFAEKMVPQDEKDRASAVQTYYESLLDKPLEVLDILDKDAQRLDLSKYIQNYRNKATESVASIFQKIQDSLEQAAFEAAMSFEKQSSAQRIQSIISDFTSSLNEQISSYMMSNLPEIKKFEYANIAAKTKAEDSLVKLNDDYAAFQIQQDKEKSKFLQRNAEELTKVFKDSMLTSQENAQFFRDKVFNQLQSGKYNEINVGNVAKEIQTERTKQFNDLIKSNTLGLPATLDLTKSQDVEGFRNATTAAMEAKAAMAPEEQREKIVNEFTLILDALNNALKASEFAKNQFAKDEIARAIAERERNKTSLELEQQNAEKELQIKQDLNRLKIAAELQYSVESNRIQKENFTRIKEAEITAKNLGFAIDIAKANSESYIAALRRGLEDPRQEYGMGVRESLERRIGIENKVLEEQRRMEDQNLATEMAQAQLQLAAEIQNTNALEKLTQVMNEWITDRLAEELGGVGSEKMQKIQFASNEMGPSAENDIDTLYGKGTYRKYQAYLAAQKNQSKLGSAGALGANAPVLDFTQLSELAKGNPVLESQVELLKKQYETREKILGIQRQTVDEDIRIKQENERLNTTIMGRLEKGFGNMAKQSDQIILDLAEKAPSAFADGMTNALMEVAKGTKSIGDALQDMVINFGQMLMQEVMRAAMYRAIGSIGSGLFQNGGIVGKQRGGIIRAENGTYIPGNRTGDRNLALLEDGEYVLNREAVAAIGVNNLDGLNYGMAPRFQSGGGFGFAAQQSLIGDELNYSGNLIGSGMDTRPVSLDDYSAYAFENDPFFKNMRQKSIEAEKERVNKEFQAKQKRAQLISSIVGAAGAAFLGVGLGNLSSAAGTAGKAVQSTSKIGSRVLERSVSEFGSPEDLVIKNQRGGLIGYQSGGFIPYGSRISDNVPRYMSGGMNAISNAANNKYISANSSRMQGGGSNSTTNNTNNTNNSNINIVANVGSYNKSGQFVLGQSGNNYDSNEMIFSQNLARNIAKVADNQIQKANRYGGFNKQSYV
jgi:TP901 family phage tail tape measure protein